MNSFPARSSCCFGKVFLVVLLLGGFLIGSAQMADARWVLSTSHKSQPGGGGAVSSDKGSGDALSSSLLRPSDDSLIKSAPGMDGNVLTGNAAAVQLTGRLSARSAVVVDTRGGRVLFAYNPDLARQPASTIKVLTTLLALDSLRDNDMVVTSHRAASMPRSKVYLQRGRSYRAGDLINATLISSANDATVALAERIAGSEANFARMMTARARSMGADNTMIINSNGLTAAGQRSTARDLALIFHNAMQHREFARRAGAISASTAFGQTLRSNNRALWQISGAEGGKTGFTRAAQQTYVGKFRRGEHELVVALMGSQSMWEDLSHLVEFGFQQLNSEVLLASAPIDSAFLRSSAVGASSAGVTVLTNAGKSGI